MTTRVAWAIAAAVLIGACGGADIPMHSGYKNEKVRPWKKPKVIVLDDKGEGKAEGDLSYRDYRRAKWYAVDLPADGELEIGCEIAPPDVEDFDLAFEVLDPNFIVIAKADLDDEDAHELVKNRTLYELTAGRYLIHLYLQGRLDSADFDLKLKYNPQAKKYQSDFPALVPFPPRLPVVPLLDDTPADQIAKRPRPGVKKTSKGRPKPTQVAEDTSKKIPARVINIAAQGNESMITVDRGVNQGVSDGMKGYVQGVKGGSFTVTSCSERQCKGKVSATPDQISRSGKVIIIGSN